ncbi:RBR-type E3 ubiquitin transferase [Salvia divinorum]|uniref:RBR-type E3 ubiquitin transferase n=1 Tax=Salvia divinorum TaxID=28513 RepID=A0ABD1I538_SALDI
MMSSIMSAFDEALSLTDHYSYADEAIQIQQALHASLSLPQNRPSSSSQTISCEICTEEKQPSGMLDCRHSFCAACISMHVQYKLRDNIITISCPAHGCGSAIQPHALRLYLAPEVLDRWEEAVAESAIHASQKVRCPFVGCSEILVNEGGNEVAECECPWCHRLFCARISGRSALVVRCLWTRRKDVFTLHEGVNLSSAMYVERTGTMHTGTLARNSVKHFFVWLIE